MKNQGYRIVDLIRTSGGDEINRGFALAHNPMAPSPWVTWRYIKSSATQYDFNSGNYWADERTAKRDFYQRVADSYAD